MRRLISSRFVWSGMSGDISTWCNECQDCSMGKVIRHVQAPLQPITVPDLRFSHLHVDLVGPLPSSQEGFNHILTVIDRSTRWVEAIPLSFMTTQACADAVIGGWMAHLGVPTIITSDRGPQFTCAVWAVLCHKMGIQHNQMTGYHPQSNGIVEWFFTDSSRRPCGPATVRPISRGSSGDSGLPLRRTLASHRQNWCMVRRSAF